MSRVFSKEAEAMLPKYPFNADPPRAARVLTARYSQLASFVGIHTSL